MQAIGERPPGYMEDLWSAANTAVHGAPNAGDIAGTPGPAPSCGATGWSTKDSVAKAHPEYTIDDGSYPVVISYSVVSGTDAVLADWLRYNLYAAALALPV